MTKSIEKTGKLYIYLQIKCASLKILESNIETNMLYVQFIWLVSLISFSLDVQIGCIFYGFKSKLSSILLAIKRYLFMKIYQIHVLYIFKYKYAQIL
jgi:hypothetical protein